MAKAVLNDRLGHTKAVGLLAVPYPIVGNVASLLLGHMEVEGLEVEMNTRVALTS